MNLIRFRLLMARSDMVNTRQKRYIRFQNHRLCCSVSDMLEIESRSDIVEIHLQKS